MICSLSVTRNAVLINYLHNSYIVRMYCLALAFFILFYCVLLYDFNDNNNNNNNNSTEIGRHVWIYMCKKSAQFH